MSQPVSPRSVASEGQINSRYKNDFEELHLLGSGGYGEVYLCLHKVDRKEYAVKVIPFASSNGEERTLWEVRTLAQMHHPNVVSYYQAWVEDRTENSVGGCSEASSGSSVPPNNKTLYVALEVCDRTLEEKLKSPLHRDEAWKIFKQICDGLKHIHKKGVIHRDLSTKNIFFDKQGVAKIGDFGLARFSCEGRVELTEFSGQGAPKYFAPETTGENPYAVMESDIFSLGMIFFELFYHMVEVSEAIRVSSNLKRSKVLPEDWPLPKHRDMLLKMIEDNPVDRPSLDALIFHFHAENGLAQLPSNHSGKKRKYNDLHHTV